MKLDYSRRPPCSDVSRNQQKVSLDLSSHAPLGADESKNWNEHSCTSALSAERLGPSAMASVYVPGGSAAGTAPNIGQENISNDELISWLSNSRSIVRPIGYAASGQH
jgi:hypothetical protein